MYRMESNTKTVKDLVQKGIAEVETKVKIQTRQSVNQVTKYIK